MGEPKIVIQKILTARQAKELDEKLKNKYGISTLVLMENAGRAIADTAVKLVKQHKLTSIAVFCGRGNNGGDGLVAARHLLTKGINVDVFLLGSPQDLKNEAKINYEILKKLKKKISTVQSIEEFKEIKKRIKRYDLIIDALLGIGLKGEVKGLMREVIEVLNISRIPVIAVDIPSGLDARSGKGLGCAIKAAYTVTFIAVKKGLLTKEGSFYSGKVKVCDLGIPFK